MDGIILTGKELRKKKLIAGISRAAWTAGGTIPARAKPNQVHPHVHVIVDEHEHFIIELSIPNDLDSKSMTPEKNDRLAVLLVHAADKCQFIIFRIEEEFETRLDADSIILFENGRELDPTLSLGAQAVKAGAVLRVVRGEANVPNLMPIANRQSPIANFPKKSPLKADQLEPMVKRPDKLHFTNVNVDEPPFVTVITVSNPEDPVGGPTPVVPLSKPEPVAPTQPANQPAAQTPIQSPNRLELIPNQTPHQPPIQTLEPSIPQAIDPVKIGNLIEMQRIDDETEVKNEQSDEGEVNVNEPLLAPDQNEQWKLDDHWTGYYAPPTEAVLRWMQYFPQNQQVNVTIIDSGAPKNQTNKTIKKISSAAKDVLIVGRVLTEDTIKVNGKVGVLVQEPEVQEGVEGLHNMHIEWEDGEVWNKVDKPVVAKMKSTFGKSTKREIKLDAKDWPKGYNTLGGCCCRISNNGSGRCCGCCQAWTIGFLSLLNMFAQVLLMPFLWASKKYWHKFKSNKVMFYLCINGIDPWTAIIAFFLGLDKLSEGEELSHFHTPSKELDKKYKTERVAYDYMASVFPEDDNFRMAEGDYDNWQGSCARHIGRWFLTSINRLYMLSHSDGPKYTKDEFQKVLSYSMTEIGANVHPRMSLQGDPNSEYNVIQWCTLGYGANLIKRKASGKGYCLDLRHYESYPMRKGYTQYGGCIYLNDKCTQVTRVIYRGRTYSPHDAAYAGVLYVIRCTCLAESIVGIHTMYCHYLDGGFSATVSRERLPADHPLRRIIAPFTVSTIDVNFGAQSLISAPGSVLHRGGGLKWTSVRAIMRTHVKDWRMERYTDELKRKGLDSLTKEQYPYGYFGKRLFKIFEKFIEAYVNCYWKTDDDVKKDKHVQLFFEDYYSLFPTCAETPPPKAATSKDQIVTYLTHLMWSVTAQHEQTGWVADYLIHDYAHVSVAGDNQLDDFANLRPNKTSQLGIVFVGALTSRPGANLLQSDWQKLHRFFLDSFPSIHTQTFLIDLLEMRVELERYNAKRDSWLFWTFDPKQLEISVTV